jgi:hypothetical protein
MTPESTEETTPPISLAEFGTASFAELELAFSGHTIAFEDSRMLRVEAAGRVAILSMMGRSRELVVLYLMRIEGHPQTFVVQNYSNHPLGPKSAHRHGLCVWRVLAGQPTWRELPEGLRPNDAIYAAFLKCGDPILFR